LSSLGLLFFIFLPIFFLGGIRNKETKFNTIISSVLILVAIGLLFALTQLRSSKWIDYTNTKADVSLIELVAFKPDTSSSSLPMSEKAEALLKEIGSTRKGLLEHLNRNGGGSTEEFILLRNMGKDLNVTHSFFFTDAETPRTELLKLTASLNEFTRELPTEVIAQLSILNTEKRKRYGEEIEEMISWEEAHFSHVTLSVALRNLSVLELAVKAAK
jgi:hypothetical protein